MMHVYSLAGFIFPKTVNLIGQRETVPLSDLATDSLRPMTATLLALSHAAMLAAFKPVTPVDTLTSGLASIARLPLGTNIAPLLEAGDNSALRDNAQLTLFDVESDADCRSVREVITFLDMNVLIKPCGVGSRFLDELAQLEGPRAAPPYLVDISAKRCEQGAEAICQHLFSAYGMPAGVGATALPSAPPVPRWLPSLLRFGRGSTVEPSARDRPMPPSPLRLYSYDGNQFCRLVREVLCECDLPYELRSTGKGSPRRAELRALSGKTTAPFLVDPNTEVMMGESADVRRKTGFEPAPRPVLPSSLVLRGAPLTAAVFDSLPCRSWTTCGASTEAARPLLSVSEFGMLGPH